MVNLLDSTELAVVNNGHQIKEVYFVTDGENWVTWDDFAFAAESFNYDGGFGLAEVNENLKVVGADWWLERYEYDGAEWWVYKELPKRPLEHGRYVRLGSREWGDDEE